MGFLRTLLALSVVFSHSYGFVFVGGLNAVRLFYIISGFLISFILVEKRAYASLGNFYINRYLRLFPIYAFAAAASFFWIMYTHDANFFRIYKSIPLDAALVLVFSNIAMFFQDWIFYLGLINN